MTERIMQVPKLPPRRRDAHKGDFGKVLIIGGSRGMVGAPALAANAAFRCGAGLVRLAVPEGIWQSVAVLAPCATTIPLSEDNAGRMSQEALRIVLEAMDQHDAVALGPGLAQSSDLQQIVLQLTRQGNRRMVVDADGLNNLANLGGPNSKFTRNTILTPHPGEMKRLWQAWIRDGLPNDRQQQAEALSARSGSVVVLKGAGTVVTDGSNTYINQTGNPGMATGGSGDVLTGCIAAFLGQGLDPLEAAVLGVHIHGLAGDLAAQRHTDISLMATDIVDLLPSVWASLGI